MTHHLLAYALSTPWALMPERMSAYAAILARHYAGQLPAGSALAAAPAVEPTTEMQAAAAAQSRARTGGIAVVPVMGAIVEWPHQIDMCEGGSSARQISRALTEAENDDAVSQVLMVFGTPGGSVYGIQELGDVINRVKAKKPVIGVAQSLAASAGYWALSQCTEAYCAPGGEVGSIGVYSGHEDISKALELAGIKIELFSAGEYKTEGHPFGPMSEDGKAYQTMRAQDYYGMFTKAVSKGRRVSIEQVRDGMGKGRVLGAKAALDAGMIDGIATMDEVMSKMQRGARAAGGRSALAAAQASLQIAQVR
jgi:signal peptide peptidase SppA